MKRAVLTAVLALVHPALPLFAADPVAVRPDVARRVATEREGFWKSVVDGPAPNVASRELFHYALALCETGDHPERLEKLFEVAGRMQQTDPSKPAYGNFRWNWGQEGYFDLNAVDFSMQAGAVLWIRHREAMPTPARMLLKPLLEKGIEGLARHRVNENYTNIALMNAGNLILLGEALGNKTALDLGLARLDAILFNLSEEGVHEYTSPTYYGVDLTDVALIERFAENAQARSKARVIRELLWTDIALNWFGPAGRMAGPHSRTYDYLGGTGELDEHLKVAGWINTPKLPSAFGQVFQAYKDEGLDPRFEAMSRRFPRLVTAVWGPGRDQTRTHYLCPDVTLGSAAAAYGGRMDMPLTVDLPGPREGVRGYFIPDGRGDPYGKKKVKESQAHNKAIHLQPFWAAAQRQGDALGLAVYRTADVPPETATLESHFVLPATVDEVWVGGKSVTQKPRQKAEFPLWKGGALVVRKGTAVVGLRVPWAADVAGNEAQAALVCDGNSFGAMRLTVTHHAGGKALPGGKPVGVALWVRIGSGLATPEAVQAWRKDFEGAEALVNADGGAVSARVPGRDGLVEVAASAPFASASSLVPATPRHVLGCDGEDLGDALLAGLEPVRFLRASDGVKPLKMPSAGRAYAEAESGLVLFPMVAEADAKATGGKFVWMPAGGGERGGSSVGRIRFKVEAEAAGPRYVWGRVLTPTPDNDSFFVSVSRDRENTMPPVEWSTGVRTGWSWVRLNGRDGKPLPIEFPKGISLMDIRVREAGARLDRVFLSSDPIAVPQ